MFMGPRWREFHCLAALCFVIHVTRRALACRVIPQRGITCGRWAAIVLIKFGCSISNLLKSANSFRVSIFFAARIGSGGPTDQEIRANKFVGKPKSCATGWVENFDFRKFAQKLTLVIGCGL